jgi:CMP/dCMP kinase
VVFFVFFNHLEVRCTVAVITISRQYGSGGDEIAAEICKMMGYHMFDKHILAQAASEVGLADDEIIDLSEENYKIRNFFDRLFGTPRSRIVRILKENDNLDEMRVVEEMPLTEENALVLERKAVDTAYQVGQIIIVGRGGQMILQDWPNVIHIRIVAPLEERIQRIRAQHKLANRSFTDSVEARRAAQDEIESNDLISADYLKRFYGVDWSDPLLYHLVINTSQLNLEQATKIIIEAVQQIEPIAEHT